MSASPGSPPRTVLITGAATGLGRAIAQHLAAPDTLLLLHYRSSANQAETVAASARDAGAEVALFQADLASIAERGAMMAAVAERATALHLLVNNVGVYLEKGLLETTPEDWQAVMESTCSAAHHLIHASQHLLRQSAPAQVINIGDSAADRIAAHPTATPYHIAKLGLHILTRSYAQLLGPDGIRVNQVSPGFLENSVGRPGSDFPLGRPGAFTDVLGAIDYLLSPAASYVSGANLVVSGGWNL